MSRLSKLLVFTAALLLAIAFQVQGACEKGYARAEPGVGECKACPMGTYSPTGRQCIECPPNTVSISKASIERKQCLPCLPNTTTVIKGTDRKLCSPCKPGYWYVTGCTDCGKGRFSPTGRRCIDCPLGTSTYTTTATNADQCSAAALRKCNDDTPLYENCCVGSRVPDPPSGPIIDKCAKVNGQYTGKCFPDALGVIYCFPLGYKPKAT